MAALDDSPRPGKAPEITADARALLTSLACRQAKDLGYPHARTVDDPALGAPLSAFLRRITVGQVSWVPRSATSTLQPKCRAACRPVTGKGFCLP
jgi:hypothetical protein